MLSKGSLRGPLRGPLPPGSNLGGDCFFFFFNFLKGLCHGCLAKYIFVSQEKLDK